MNAEQQQHYQHLKEQDYNTDDFEDYENDYNYNYGDYNK